MKKLTVLLILGLVYNSNAQDEPADYILYAIKADSFMLLKDYKKAANLFSKAFTKSIGFGQDYDRYNAACCWAIIGEIDSAFYNIELLAKNLNYLAYNHIKNDVDLISLHDDSRWNPLLEIIKENKEKENSKYNMPLKEALEKIYADDQIERQLFPQIKEKYGISSNEIEKYWKNISKKDSINLIKVKSILDVYGWVGKDKVGYKASSAIFLVIQHAEPSIQEIYLPIMREAVKKGNASKGNLGLLEDRVAVAQGKYQIYGSQYFMNIETNQYEVPPIIDLDNLDKRRAEVGMGSMTNHLKVINIKWNIEQYKKDLPMLVEKYLKKK